MITNRQTSGRGQRGNRWEAEENMNFTLSLILKPTGLAIQDQFYLNIFTSLAIHDYVAKTNAGLVQIKWPNDILINGKKLCGILIENQISGGKFSNSIVGIGLNMNQKIFDLPTATSLSLVVEKDFELADELEPLLHILELRYLQLCQRQYATLMNDYLNKLYWLNERHVFSSNDSEFEGEIIGIDSVGRLVIRTDKGERNFDLKEIRYVQ